jgi:hypothetical protein
VLREGRGSAITLKVVIGGVCGANVPTQPNRGDQTALMNVAAASQMRDRGWQENEDGRIQRAEGDQEGT